MTTSHTSEAPIDQSGSTPFLRVRTLTKRFGGFAAVDDVNLDVFPGEFLCLLGPSGCGKTTVLRAIAGLDRQDSGKIEMQGRDISHAPPMQRDFGIVFQSYALFPNLTVAENVAYGLFGRQLTKTGVNARVSELLDLVNLKEQHAKYPAQLSGGQQQRVALVRALAPAPALLLLDEPLSALDAKVRTRLRDLVVSIQRNLNVTTIMVTHDQEEALTMASRIAVMNAGKIEQIGTPEAIYRHPGSAFVADFVGATTFLTGVLSSKREVRIADVCLEVCNDTDMGVGTTVRLAVRPESIQVRDLAQKNDVSRLHVAIEKLNFLGAYCRATLIPLGARECRILADFSANLVRDLAIKVGQEIQIGIAPTDIRMFPVQDGGKA